MRTGPYGHPLIREYGCTLCQRHHRETLDPEYARHLHRQSKHGPRDRVATPNEALALVRAATPAH